MKRDWFLIAVPFLAGGITALVFVSAVGWMTTSEAARTAIAMARIDERAAVCHEAAIASLNSEQQEQIRDAALPARNELAAEFIVPTGNVTTDRRVQDECSRKLAT